MFKVYFDVVLKGHELSRWLTREAALSASFSEEDIFKLHTRVTRAGYVIILHSVRLISSSGKYH